MPYAIEARDGKFAVVNKDTGKVYGTHATRAKAEAQMRALYANSGDEAKSPRHLRLAVRSLKAQAEALADMFSDEEESGTDSDETSKENEQELPAGVPGVLKDNYVKSLGYSADLGELAVKSIGKDEIRAYSQLWGNDKITDLELEYFTKSTDFWDSALKDFQRPLTWDHATDKEFKASPIIGKIVEFGDDEVGRWMVAKLERNHRYRKAVDALIEAGAIGVSSDSAPQYVERVKTGKSTWLKTWPFFAAALTDQPCEPRMLTDGSPEFLKSLGITLPDALAEQTARQFEALKNRTRLLKLKEY